MIREGEESQEDSLKIRSDENFLESWLWILRIFLLDFHFTCDLELRNFLNSQTWQTSWTAKITCGRWKFDQKMKNWTWLHVIGFSFWIMNKQVSFDSKMYFMRFGWKYFFTIRDEKVCLMWFDERKSLKFTERMLCVLKIVWEV